MRTHITLYVGRVAMNTEAAETTRSQKYQNGRDCTLQLRIAGFSTGNSAGFSFVELIVVVVILGLLMAVAIPTWSHLVTRSKVSRCQADLRTLEKEITAYLIEKGTLPPSLNAIGRGDIRDPWLHPYQYVNIVASGTAYVDFLGTDLNTDFDLYSLGQDGISTQSLADAVSENDIVRAGDGGFIGLGYDF